MRTVSGLVTNCSKQAGQSRKPCITYPRQESNLRLQLKRKELNHLSYGGETYFQPGLLAALPSAFHFTWQRFASNSLK